MDDHNTDLGTVKPDTMVHIKHLGKARFKRLNQNKHAVISFDGRETTMVSYTKVKILTLENDKTT